jgi:hypothetical protein
MRGINRIRIAVLLLILTGGVIFSQEDDARDTKAISLGFSMENLSAGLLEARAGVVLEDFLGMGVLWGLGFENVGGSPANDIAVGIWADAALLREDELIPVSVHLTAAFEKSRTSGAYLESNDLMMSSTGYTIGIHAARTFSLSDTWSLTPSLTARYLFTTVTTEAIPGSGSTFDTLIESAAEYEYGLDVVAAALLNEAIALEFGAFLHLNDSFDFLYGPVVGLATR